jgi:hypothetical protein
LKLQKIGGEMKFLKFFLIVFFLIIPVSLNAISLRNMKIEDGDGTDLADVVTAADDDTDIDGLKGVVINGISYYRIDADTIKPARMDASTHSIQTIDYAQHEVHGGNHFTYSQVDADFDIADAVELLIVTPNTTKWAHMIFEVNAALDTNIVLTEGATHTVLAAQNVYNNNRNSATANTTTINTHNDDGANGTTIFTSQIGISTGVGISSITGGGAARSETEWVLDQNNKYLLIVTSGSDNSVLSIKISWYEHIDKD